MAVPVEAQWRGENPSSRAEECLARIERRLDQLIDMVDSLYEHMLEQRYRERAVAYFGSLLRRPRVVSRETLAELLEPRLTFEELNDVLLLDLVVRGQPRHRQEVTEVWLAVEVSAVVDRRDVARVLHRAALLRRAGYQVIPVVAGEHVTQGAEEEARQHKVVMMLDGRGALVEEAAEAWITP